jgi:hypothetical protein
MAAATKLTIAVAFALHRSVNRGGTGILMPVET